MFHFINFSAQNTDPKKTDNDILNEVLEEVNKKEKNMILKNLKKFWKPAHKPFFDKECNVSIIIQIFVYT